MLAEASVIYNLINEMAGTYKNLTKMSRSSSVSVKTSVMTFCMLAYIRLLL